MDEYLKPLVDEGAFEFYKAVCDFGAERIAPNLLKWEREGLLIPPDAMAGMAEMGLFGITVEEQYGGQGGSLTELVLMGLATGYHSQSVAITPGAGASLGIKPLQMFGTEAQKTAHLPDLAAGRGIGPAGPA
ncbi:MAG: acyl-CoA dehydrogenase family protein [Candidatus Riflebacteria bacterium]|nr:acyl-CoA dehydrogenase family protein [Candidatus Riflebacteria bacterium]